MKSFKRENLNNEIIQQTKFKYMAVVKPLYKFELMDGFKV